MNENIHASQRWREGDKKGLTSKKKADDFSNSENGPKIKGRGKKRKGREKEKGKRRKCKVIGKKKKKKKKRKRPLELN